MYVICILCQQLLQLVFSFSHSVDLKAMEGVVRSIKCDGLVWGTSKYTFFFLFYNFGLDEFGWNFVNPLTPNTKDEILLSCPHTFLIKVLGRSYQNIKKSHLGWSYCYSHDLSGWITIDIRRRNLMLIAVLTEASFPLYSLIWRARGKETSALGRNGIWFNCRP